MKKNSLKQSSFANDVVKLATGSAVSQVIPIIAGPILTRIYGPDMWGLLAVFVSITTILNVVACMRYELAIMLPKDNEEAANLLAISLTFPLLIFLLLIFISSWNQEVLLQLLNAPGLGPYLWLVPTFVLINGIFLALNYWNSRTKHYGRLSIARVTSSSATVAGKISFGYSGYANAGTLLYATVIGQAIATSILGGQIWRDDRNIFIKSIRWQHIRNSMVRYCKFPLVSTWAALLNVISLQTPALLLSFYFSPAIVGLYALGNRMLTQPLKFIGNAISQVFYQRAAVAFVDGTISEMAGKTARYLALLGSFPMLLIAVLGADLFSFVFGYKWREAGIYAQILVPWTMIVFISSPLSSLNSVFEKQALGLVFNVVQLSTRIISLVIGGLTGNIFLGLALFSLTGVMTSISFLSYHLKCCGVQLRSLGFDILGYFLRSAIFIAPLVILKYLMHLSIIPILAIAVFLTIGYYIFIIMRNKALLRIIKMILKRK